MLSEQVAKIWRRVTFALAMLTTLEYSGAFRPIVYFFASERLLSLYETGYFNNMLFCCFFTALFVSIMVYVLVQPKKWKGWIYSDYARYGGFVFGMFYVGILFFNAFYREILCQDVSFIRGNLPLLLSFLIWLLPPVLRKINKITSYAKIDSGTQITLMAYLIIGLLCIKCKGVQACGLSGEFDKLIYLATLDILWGLIVYLPFSFSLASLWVYYMEAQKMKKPFLFRFLVYWLPFICFETTYHLKNEVFPYIFE